MEFGFAGKKREKKEEEAATVERRPLSYRISIAQKFCHRKDEL